MHDCWFNDNLNPPLVNSKVGKASKNNGQCLVVNIIARYLHLLRLFL